MDCRSSSGEGGREGKARVDVVDLRDRVVGEDASCVKSFFTIRGPRIEELLERTLGQDEVHAMERP